MIPVGGVYLSLQKKKFTVAYSKQLKFNCFTHF